MELIPKPETPSPDAPVRKELPRAAASNQSSPKLAARPEARTGKKEGDSYRGTRSGRAYIPLQEAPEEPELSGQGEAVAAPGNGKVFFWIIVVVAAGLALGATYWSWHQFSGNSAQNLLSLTAADVDQQVTQAARTSLLRGQVPSYLSSASTEVLNKIKNGEMDLVSKNLVDASPASGTMVHVYISINGQAAANEVLTPEHPKTTVFPISRNSVTRFHYVVDSAGPSGTVSLSVPSSSGSVLSTGPLATGAQADLQLIER
ncbi:MAG TPA: hypothetical protein VHS80_06030 [Chthoniobacterales bacterium]|jgi:hypothetical protein|nr:hypothetical protein [Chthoniobacterales bacterium]